MKTIAEIQAIVANAINDMNWEKEPFGLYRPIGYTLSIGGKHLRPMLTLMAADLFGGDIQTALPAAMGIEVFHNFTLLHDDIMDRAAIRRGHPTVHVKWDQNTAILSGDAMVIEAYRLVAQTPSKYLKQVLDVFTKTAFEICEGQQYDVDFEHSQVGIEEYMKMIRLKTAVLLGCALQIGSIISNASKHDQKAIYQFGIHLGLAFQLQDDYLDVYGDEKTFGKAIGGDIICGKKSFPLLSAIKAANNEQKQTLFQLIENSNIDNEKKIAAVTQLYNELGVPQKSEETLKTQITQAIAALDSINISENRKKNLLDLTKKITHRVD